MSGQENEITLTASNSEVQNFEKDVVSIPADKNFVKAVVVHGNWVIYNTQSGKPSKYITKPLYNGNGFGQLENGKKPITAVKIINFIPDGICLFEHHQYWGENFVSMSYRCSLYLTMIVLNSYFYLNPIPLISLNIQRLFSNM